jgi:hypothetical protein
MKMEVVVYVLYLVIREVEKITFTSEPFYALWFVPICKRFVTHAAPSSARGTIYFSTGTWLAPCFFPSRERLEQRLSIIEEVLQSAMAAYPAWNDDELIQTVESQVDISSTPCVSYPNEYKFLEFPGGQNVRAYVVDAMHELVERLIGSPEEQAQSLSFVGTVSNMQESG